MNYLAHLHLANLTNTSLIGAFLGDFVKGNNYQKWHPDTQQGILLHRKVDVFTDSHPLIAETRQSFPDDLRRMAGIILDIFFDHLLAKKMLGMQPDGTGFVDDFYEELATVNLPENNHFTRLQRSLLAERWLLEYQYIDTCRLAFTGIEKRLRNKIYFASAAQRFIETHESELHEVFREFYPRLASYASETVEKHLG